MFAKRTILDALQVCEYASGCLDSSNSNEYYP